MTYTIHIYNLDIIGWDELSRRWGRGYGCTIRPLGPRLMGGYAGRLYG